MLLKCVLANDTHFVYAAPKSMTIAVFSPPLTKPSNKGIVPNVSEKRRYLALTILNLHRMKGIKKKKIEEKICCLPVGLGWTFRGEMTSQDCA